MTARDYLQVFACLAALTVLEVAGVYTVTAKFALAVFLLATAAAKAALVVLYFMHLKTAHNSLRALAAFPFLLGAGFVLALFPDIVAPWY